MKPLVAHEYMLPNNYVDLSALREDLYDYFNTLHYMLSDTEFDHISSFAKGWLDSHLADHSVLENSIRQKAYEISSGNSEADYFLALLQRRDQLLAARDVFREYTSLLRDIFSEQRESVLKQLSNFDFNEGIYLRALDYHKAREKAMADYEKALAQELSIIEAALNQEDKKIAAEVSEMAEEKPKRTRKKSTTVKARKSEGKTGRYFHKSI